MKKHVRRLSCLLMAAAVSISLVLPVLAREEAPEEESAAAEEQTGIDREQLREKEIGHILQLDRVLHYQCHSRKHNELYEHGLIFESIFYLLFYDRKYILHLSSSSSFLPVSSRNTVSRFGSDE